MTRIRVPAPISAGVLLTYKCSAACRHCLYACSPTWPADWISPEDLEACLAILSSRIRPNPWGAQTISFNYGLHFTGGEPFLNFDLLLHGVRVAHEFQIPSLFVETNCFWCSNDDVTREKLQTLKEAGLRGILISVNPFYAEHIPFERTERGIRLSKQVFGRNVLVYQSEFYRLFRQLGIRERLSLEDYLKLTNHKGLAGAVELFLSGRAAYQLKDLYPAFPPERFFAEPCLTPFLRDWHNHFDNYGNYMPGFCGGISLGPWRDLDRLVTEGLELKDYPILKFLIFGDVGGLWRFAGDYGYQALASGYVSKCHLCLDLRRFLAGKEDFQELRPREFYEHLGKN
jgi:hypothetical protein